MTRTGNRTATCRIMSEVLDGVDGSRQEDEMRSQDGDKAADRRCDDTCNDENNSSTRRRSTKSSFQVRATAT